jgi:hypothetical protein
MPITSTHPEYDARLARWQRNRALWGGQDAVKALRTVLLPDDNADDPSPEARQRYQRLLDRATLLPVARRTALGYRGMVMRLAPAIELPPQLEYLLEDADGNGTSLAALAALALTEAIVVGRLALLAEYPRTDGEALTAAQVAARNLRARIALYPAESLDNWRTDSLGAYHMAKLVEATDEASEADEFGHSPGVQYRVLRLRPDGYTQELLDDTGGIVEPEAYPLQADRSRWPRIPLQVVDADAPLSGVVDLNVTHYQLTADLLKNLHLHSGALMTVASQDTLDTFMQANPQGVVLGGGDRGLWLGAGGSLQLHQVMPADAVATELGRIEQQMLMVGAHLITPSVQETAEAARIDAESRSCALLDVVDVVSEAIEAALEDCARYMGADPDAVRFALNRELYPQGTDVQALMLQIQLLDRGVVAVSDVRAELRQAGMIAPDRTDDDIDAEAGDGADL